MFDSGFCFLCLHLSSYSCYVVLHCDHILMNIIYWMLFCSFLLFPEFFELVFKKTIEFECIVVF